MMTDDSSRELSGAVKQMTAPMTPKQAMLELAKRINSAKQSWNNLSFECTEAEKDIFVAALRSAQQVPVGWFVGNSEDGFHQVAKEFEGTEGTTPLFPAPVLGAGAREALEIIGNGGNAVFPQWRTTGPKTREQMAEIARAALADTVTETGGWGEGTWQPIETAPHGKRVLLGWHDWRDHQWCVEVGPATTGQRFDNGYSNLSQHGSATHWQPLPPPLSVSSTDRKYLGGCKNCGDPIVEEGFCGTCREMGCK